MKPSHPYFSYLLRMWRSGENEQATWHASLEDPMTRKRLGFHTLPGLFTFLEEMSRSGNEQAPLHNEQAELEEERE